MRNPCNSIAQMRFCYLGGGTALALQLGHRISEDLDFFVYVVPEWKVMFRQNPNIVLFSRRRPQIRSPKQIRKRSQVQSSPFSVAFLSLTLRANSRANRHASISSNRPVLMRSQSSVFTDRQRVAMTRYLRSTHSV